jgi:murein DD-endopeptidase MepM/ murein hydrolase activator NlpD
MPLKPLKLNSKIIRSLFVLTLMLTGVVCLWPQPLPMGATVTDKTNVKLKTERGQGGSTCFLVENSEMTEVTMTFDFSTQNLKSDVTFPYTATFKPGETAAFTLAPADTNQQWEYSFTNYYKLGSSVAVPDDYVYSLPYAPGTTHRITQGYNGKFSHQGSNKYAIDWQMPEGTAVCAARGGLVVKVKDDSDLGGPSIKFDPYNNYVLIRHDDGTLGHYCHLKKGGVMVHPGQVVKTGEMIALSGNTGFSSGAHLHFCVFMAKDGLHRESIPVKFRVADADAITLVEGRKYRAAEAQADVKTVASRNVIGGG